MKLTVVISAYNNQNTLMASLRSFADQSLDRSLYEVVVVDDGSTDQTRQLLPKLGQELGFRFVQQSNQGAATARNHGVRLAKNPVILFSQADILAEPELLSEHFQFHQDNPNPKAAMVGFITWDAAMRITPFMRWLEHGGPQFDYDRLKPGQLTDYLSFYTPNLSLKKKFFLEHHGFDENLHTEAGVAVYEDTELGWRLFHHGMQLIYQPNAVAYHHHPKDLASVIRARYCAGQIYPLIKRKHPSFTFFGDESWRHRLTHLKASFIPETWQFKLMGLPFNRYTVWPLEKLANFLQGKLNVGLLYKIVCGYRFNQGYAKTLYQKNAEPGRVRR